VPLPLETISFASKTDLRRYSRRQRGGGAASGVNIVLFSIDVAVDAAQIRATSPRCLRVRVWTYICDSDGARGGPDWVIEVAIQLCVRVYASALAVAAGGYGDGDITVGPVKG
jgi:hypothetical protein